MSFNRDSHHRQSIRLRNYNYSAAGFYFITLCAFERECLFGEMAGGELALNAAGRCIETIWETLPQRYPEIEIDAFVVMPNHIHGIIVIVPVVGAIHESPGFDHCPESVVIVHRDPGAIRESPLPDTIRDRRAKTLPKVIGYLKMNTAKHINQWRATAGMPIWQRNYYERVIRNDRELDAIRQYIADNPARWGEDENHPAQPMITARSRRGDS